jgi:hypothetical protein
MSEPVRRGWVRQDGTSSHMVRISNSEVHVPGEPTFFFIGSTRSSSSAMLVLLIIVAVLIVGVLLGRMGDRTRDGEGMSPVALSGVI